MGSDKPDQTRMMLLQGFAVSVLLIGLLVVVAFIVTSAGGSGAKAAKESVIILKPAGNASLTDSQLSSIQGLIQSRFGAYGDNVSVTALRDSGGSANVTIHYREIRYSDVVSLATESGAFKLQVQTRGNDTDVLDGGDIRNVSAPIRKNLSDDLTLWSVYVNLTDDGARKFRQACIDAGITTDPEEHPVRMLIGSDAFYASPIDSQLAVSIAAKPQVTLCISAGANYNGKALAQKVSAFLNHGSLPARLEVIYSENQTGEG